MNDKKQASRFAENQPAVPSAKPTNNQPITIAAGESLSTTLDLTSGALSLLISPPQWTPANISLQVSDDNVTFSDLYEDGVEVLRPMGPARASIVPLSLTQAACYLKIRSGPAANPVPQEADRVFYCVIG